MWCRVVPNTGDGGDCVAVFMQITFATILLSAFCNLQQIDNKNNHVFSAPSGQAVSTTVVSPYDFKHFALSLFIDKAKPVVLTIM